MAVYELTIDGKASGKLRQAKTKAQAISGIVEAKALSADEVAERIRAGAVIETAGPATPVAGSE